MATMKKIILSASCLFVGTQLFCMDSSQYTTSCSEWEKSFVTNDDGHQYKLPWQKKENKKIIFTREEQQKIGKEKELWEKRIKKVCGNQVLKGWPHMSGHIENIAYAKIKMLRNSEK